MLSVVITKHLLGEEHGWIMISCGSHSPVSFMAKARILVAPIAAKFVAL